MKNVSTRRPGGLFTIGTTGWLIALYYWILLRNRLYSHTEAKVQESARTVLAIETAQASRDITLRYGPGHPAMRLPQENGVILPIRRVHDLGEECLRRRNTRPYGEVLRRLPDASTEDGVGAMPIVALANGLAYKPQLDQLIERDFIAQRERKRIAEYRDRGEGFSLDGRSLQVIAGNGGGGTFPGLALYVAQRVQHYSLKHLGAPSEILLFLTMPSALSGGDPVTAQGNFTTLVRQAVIATEDHRRIVFQTFMGEELRAERPLITRIVPWGISSGRLAIGTREELAAQMALAASVLLDTPYGSFAEAEFRDHEKDTIDQSYGTRRFARMGVSRWSIDGVRNNAIAQAEGVRLVSEHLLSGSFN